MSKMQSIIAVIAVVFILILFAPSAESFEGTDLETYERGKALAFRNCGDCYGRTREGLEAARTTLESLLDKPIDSNEIYFVLADVYRTLAFRYYKRFSSERADLLKKEKEVLALAAAMSPDSVDALMRAARTLEGEERIEVLRKVIGLDPDNVDAHMSLALQLKQGSEAIELGKRAYALANPHEKERYGRKLGYLFIVNSDRSGYIEFNLRNLNEVNSANNSSLSAASRFRLSLEPLGGRKTFENDMPFDVVFTNIGARPHTVVEHDRVTPQYFWFTLHPAYPDTSIIKPSGYENSRSSVGLGLDLVELPPNEEFRISTRLSDVLPKQHELPDGDYIISLHYRGDLIRGPAKLPSALFSDAVYFRISNFRN